MRDERGPWYLLTGLLIGAAVGLAYAWFYAPVQYVDASPASLSDVYRDHYRVLISAAFAANGDLPRAQARLKLLDEPDPARILAVQAQRALAEKHPESEINALGLLAVSLSGNEAPVLVVPLTTSHTPSPTLAELPSTALPPTATLSSSSIEVVEVNFTASPQLSNTAAPQRTSTSTITPLPTRTPTPTPGSPFALKDKSPLCDIKVREPRIIINTLDAAGQPVPGVEVIVSWPGGEDRLFTGLKPELGLGYGDFQMVPGTSYSVHLAEGGELVQDLLSSECETRAGERFWGSWALLFAQP